MATFMIGCNGGQDVGCVVGAEQLATSAGVWVKARFYREGPFLCATVYSVAQGEPRIFEMKVDLRPITRALVRAHAVMHRNDLKRAVVNGATVGWSLGSMWKGVKNAAKKIGRSKLVKGVAAVTKTVGKAVKTVAKSKAFGAVLAVGSAFPLTAPFAAPALAAYAAANTAIEGVEQGKKLVDTAKKAKSVISQGAKLGKSIVNKGKAAGKTVSKQAVLAAPLVKLAASVQQKLKDPAVKKRLLAVKVKADKSKAALEQVQQKALSGSLDAQKSAAIVNLVARNRARIQAMSQASTGGLPGLLITPQGKIVRGRFRVQPKASARGLLYRGPGSTERGDFATVSGMAHQPIGADIMIGCGGCSSPAAA